MYVYGMVECALDAGVIAHESVYVKPCDVINFKGATIQQYIVAPLEILSPL